VRKHHGDERLLAELNGASCRSKERHPSKAHALAVGRRILREGGARERRVLVAYKCRTCGCWHNGNTDRRRVTDPQSIARATRATDAPPTLLERQLAFVLAHVMADASE
jgi:hypothetical protein